MDTALAWILRGGAALLFLLAATKAHGRQVRLEREAVGVLTVDFLSANPPAVEAIWARDRRTLWTVFAVLGGVAVVFGVLNVVVFGLSLGVVALSLVWAFAASFAVAGVSSQRYRRRTQAGRTAGSTATALWWLVVAASGLAAVGSLAL